MLSRVTRRDGGGEVASVRYGKYICGEMGVPENGTQGVIGAVTRCRNSPMLGSWMNTRAVTSRASLVSNPPPPQKKKNPD